MGVMQVLISAKDTPNKVNICQQDDELFAVSDCCGSRFYEDTASGPFQYLCMCRTSRGQDVLEGVMKELKAGSLNRAMGRDFTLEIDVEDFIEQWTGLDCVEVCIKWSS